MNIEDTLRDMKYKDTVEYNDDIDEYKLYHQGLTTEFHYGGDQILMKNEDNLFEVLQHQDLERNDLLLEHPMHTQHEIPSQQYEDLQFEERYFLTEPKKQNIITEKKTEYNEFEEVKFVRKRDIKTSRKTKGNQKALSEKTQASTQFSQEEQPDTIRCCQRTGRPFTNQESVSQDGMENHVKEKRGIFRLSKRIVGNLNKTDLKIRKNMSLLKNLSKDADNIDQKELQQYIRDCRNTMSYDHLKKKASEEGVSLRELEEENSRQVVSFKKGKHIYHPIIGDPCYRFKRYAKERFFEQPLYRRVFLHMYTFLRENKKLVSKDTVKVLDELFDYAKQKEENLDFLEKQYRMKII